MSNQVEPLDNRALAEMLGATELEIKKWDELVPEGSISYPIADFASLGMAFSGLSFPLEAISNMAKHTGTLYEATFPVAGKLAIAKDGSGLLGTIINEHGIAGQARFKEVGQVAQVAGGLSTFFMAMAIISINMSLKNIAENQKAILSFLDAEKQTQLQGDLNILSEIITDFQFNWNVSQWAYNREMQVLDIKRNAEHNILFYRDMIEKKTDETKQFIRLDTKKTLGEILNKLKYYKLALYIFSFSSFLDVMLVRNFDSNYLDSVKRKIEDYSIEYNSFYSKSIEGVEKIASASIQHRAIQGLSIAGRFLGKQIAKIPDKNNKIKLDDKLISGGDKLDEINEKTMGEIKESFSSLQDNGIQMFCDKVDLVNRLSNEKVKVYIGADNLYLARD